MNKAVRVAAMTATIGLATVSPAAPAHAGDAVGAGLIGFGVGAILGSLFTPWEVYVGPPPYYYWPVVYGPPPPYYYYECDYYGPPEGHWHRPPAHATHAPANATHATPHATHATPTAYNKPQPQVAKASRDELTP